MDKEGKLRKNRKLREKRDKKIAADLCDMKGSIYKIWSPGRPEVYVGSSQCSLKKIMARHKGTLSNWLADKGDFVTSIYIFYQKLAGHPVYIETLEEGEFETVGDLHKLEGEYIEKLPTVNSYKPIRLVIDKKSKITCPSCGKVVIKQNLKRHQEGRWCVTSGL